MNKHVFLLSLLALNLSISACQTSQSPAQPLSPDTSFADLQAEYAPFTTQALTQNYLQRKLNRWEQQNNGEAMKRELMYGVLKHPALLSQALKPNALCANTLGFPEVIQERSINPNLDSLLQGANCGGAGYTGEFQVNTTAIGSQNAPKIAMTDDGGFVVVWMSTNPESSDSNIFAQRFHPDGSPAGTEFLINTYTTDAQFNPSIAMSDDGSFVVIWTSEGQDGSGNGIYGQRFQSDGSPAGTEFPINTYTTNAQFIPSIAMSGDGSFVVVWTSEGQDGSGYGIYGQRFQSDGSPAGAEFQINTTTNEHQNSPRVAMADDGTFIVVWQGNGQSSETTDIYGQWYLNDGTPDGGEFMVNPIQPGVYHYSPDVALNNNKTVVVSYGRSTANWTGSGQDIYATHMHKNNAFPASTFRVNDHTLNPQRIPYLSLSEDGHVVISWSSLRQDLPNQPGGMALSSGIYAKRYFNNAGTLEAGDEFRVNTTIQSGQFQQHVASNGESLVFVWTSNGQDGDSMGIFAQRVEPSPLDASVLWK